jgi:hypothetical protein
MIGILTFIISILVFGVIFGAFKKDTYIGEPDKYGDTPIKPFGIVKLVSTVLIALILGVFIPFEVERVKNFIRRDLDPIYQGQYEIQVVPNIVHIGWGRGVGYTSGEETFDESVTNISATKIRKEMGLE